MAWRRPLLEVRTAGGLDVLPRLSGLWTSVKVSDKAGQESDTCRIACAGPPDRVPLPRRGDKFTVLMGWADEGLVLQGEYSFQKARLVGDPGRGESLELRFRAADFVDALKRSGREHYDDVTFGDLVRKIAGKAGLGSEVDPDLAGRKLGYRLRWDQSLIDFGTEIADELGATIKPAGGKLIASKRGGGKNAGGRALEPILIRRRWPSFGYEVEIDPRPEAGKVAAAWQDEKTGRRKHVKKEAGSEGPTRILPHPYRSESDAGAAAEAEAYETANRSGSGTFESPGLPRARAEAPVIVSGFGPAIDGPWKADGIESVVTAKGGYLTTVSVTAGKDKKGSKGK